MDRGANGEVFLPRLAVLLPSPDDWPLIEPDGDLGVCTDVSGVQHLTGQRSLIGFVQCQAQVFGPDGQRSGLSGLNDGQAISYELKVDSARGKTSAVNLQVEQ